MKTISNIATTKEQSARLLQCGVDPKTADMCLSTRTRRANGTPIAKKSQTTNLWVGYPCWRTTNDDEELDNLPAWSLPALLALLPEKIEDGYWLTIQKCSSEKNGFVCYGIAYIKCKWDNPKDISNSTITTLGRLKYFTDRNLIEAVCKLIEWLTANNYKLNEL